MIRQPRSVGAAAHVSFLAEAITVLASLTIETREQAAPAGSAGIGTHDCCHDGLGRFRQASRNPFKTLPSCRPPALQIHVPWRHGI